MMIMFEPYLFFTKPDSIQGSIFGQLDIIEMQQTLGYEL